MKKKQLGQLKTFYLFVFILGTLIIVPTHIVPPPYFMPFRFPHYLEMMGPIFRISWPVTFEIYHWIILIIGVVGLINVLGLVFSKMKPLAKLSSLVGLFLFSFMILFFFFVFISVNAPTAVIYGSYSVILLIVDWITFKSLSK